MSASPSEPRRLEGRAFAAGRSRPEAAALVLEDGEARLLAGDGRELGRVPRSGLRFEAPIGRADRRLTLPDGTLFETGDQEGAAALDAGAGAMLHRLERFHPRLVLVVLACLGGVWLVWRYGLDLVVAAAIALTPQPAIAAVDAGVLRSIDLAVAEPSQASEADRQAAAAVFERLVAALPPEGRAEHDFELRFRRLEGFGPNALALPGGTVVLTDAFLEAAPEADVRAGVLAHEIGHVVERHGLRQLYRSLGVAVLVPLMAGDTAPVIEDVLLEGSILLSLTFSRASERSADAFGVALSSAAGYDPAGLLAFLEEISEDEPARPGWASTHPATAERIEAVRAQIEEAGR